MFSLTLPALATPITPEKAIEIASRHAGFSKQTGIAKSPVKEAYKIVYVRQPRQGSQAYFYAVGKEKQPGFILVGGDDTLPEVLGYSETGTFSPSAMSPAMKGMLDNWDRQIEYLLAHPGAKRSKAAATITPIEPLLGNTAWDQTEPYNAKCPTVQLYDGWGDPAGTGPAATGCVATAVGQIMYYHQWPPVGHGSVSYTSEGEDESMNINVTFEGTSYNWDAMLPSLDKESPAEAVDAVSTLLYHLGAGLESVYGAATGALDISVAPALTKYFDYDRGIRYLARDYVPGNEWDAIILQELKAKRPIAYGGVTRRQEGHFFVLDGVDASGYYHINWGWSGMENGYYLLSLLEPGQQGTGGADSGEAFHYSQNMIVGIQPPKGDAPVLQYNYICERLGALSTVLSRQATAPLSAEGVWNNCANPSTVNLGFAMLDADGKVVLTQWIKQDQTYKVGFGEESLQCSFIVPDNIPEGTYKVVPAFTVKDEPNGEVHVMPVFNGRANYYRAEIGVDKISWELADNYSLTMLDITADNGTIESGVSKTITVKVKNDGSDFHGPVQLRAFIKDKEKVFGRTDIPEKAMWVNIPGHCESEVTFTLPEKFSLPGNDNYVMRLWGNEGSFDEDGYAQKPLNLCSKEGVKVVGPALPPVLSVADDIIVTTLQDGAVPKNDIGLKVFVENEGGEWTGQIQAKVFDPEDWSGKPMGFVTFDAVTIDPECEMWLDLTGGEFPEGCLEGMTYDISLLNPADGDFMVPSYYTDLSLKVGAPIDKTPALACESVELNPATPMGGNDVTVTYKLRNSGYRYIGNLHFDIRLAGETKFSSALTDVRIERNDESEVVFNETLPDMETSDNYQLVLLDADNVEIHTQEGVQIKGTVGIDLVAGDNILISRDGIYAPGAFKIELYSSDGVLLRAFCADHLDLRNLSKGVYIVTVTYTDHITTTKISK